MQPITGRHSLSPRSHTRFVNSAPHGLPALIVVFRNQGDESGLPRSQSCRFDCSRIYPFSARLFLGSDGDDVHPMWKGAT